MAVYKRHPILHVEARYAYPRHRADRIRHGCLQTPGRVAGVDFGFCGKAQNHFLAGRAGDDAFEDAIEDEILLHRLVALVFKRRVFGVITDFEHRLKF